MSWLQLARAVFGRDPLGDDYESPPAYGPADLSHAGLTGPQERVIRLRFGLEPQNLTIDEVAAIMRVTRERVRQMEEKAIRKMREAAGEGRGDG